MRPGFFRILLSLLVAAAAALAFAAGPARVVFLPFSDARPVLDAMHEALPEGLAGLSPEQLQAAWPAWVKSQDAAIRARLESGDEDTVVNFLLFGTSFTHQPRITFALLQQSRDAISDPNSPFGRLLHARASDLVHAMAAPGENERLSFARRVVERKSGPLSSDSGRAAAAEFLLRHFGEISRENAHYAALLEAARSQGDPTEEMATRSTLFQSRGLSLDTSWRPNFSIEQALATLIRNGTLAPNSVRRVAVIGPGLDFTDKAEGYDFYPPQTVQPFAVFDSLVRLGLARPGSLQVTTLDISARINQHITRARARARQGMGYIVELTLDPATPWKPDALAYWKAALGKVGLVAPSVHPPATVGTIETRAVRVPPDLVLRISPVDLDIVLQRIVPPTPEGRFDLIVATNILVYYDVFEQSLAVRNIAAMLRSGGLLLTNNNLLELPGSPLRSQGYVTVVYSDLPDDGDHLIWYQNLAP